MTRFLFYANFGLTIIFVGLSQLPDPGFLGLAEEPDRILYYAVTGGLAALFGVVAVASGSVLLFAKPAEDGPRRRRAIYLALSILMLAVMAALVMQVFSSPTAIS